MDKNIFSAVKAADRAYLERAISSREAVPDQRDQNGNTLMHIAVELKRNELAILELLISNGWDVNSQNNLGATPLHYVALRKDSGRPVALLLLKNLANTQISTNLGHTPLHLACERYKLELVQVLLEHKAIPGSMDRNNNTPLHVLLLSQGRDTVAREIVEVLIKGGARLDTKNCEGNDSLLLASSRGFTRVCQLLLQNGSNPRITNDFGNTVVHLSSAAGHSELVEMLLELEMPYINVTNADGDTPLHLAVKNNHAEVAAVLIKKGSSIATKNAAGKSPLDLVSQDEKSIFAVKHPELIKLISSRKPKSKVPEEEDIGCLIF
ncbi:hypothetical protein SteCoe_14008 [Stentor coeruleus]|uniref:Uncharacterized protein n=1 Tax=Stentor coeruleus TaxID=5963 RepID=A0A1R2C775_9CILI|nr:hypothetical protein SteCoe_14008 [Stentor coeruleus]